LWEAAVIANGGSVSLARRIIVDEFVYAEKAAGNWALTDDYHVFWAENSAQALTSLKRRILAVAYNVPTFTANRDFTTDGATSYIDTLFVPSTDAVSMTASSVHLEIYERTNLNTNTYAIGVTNTSNRQLAIRPRIAAGTTMSANSGGTTYTLPALTSLGLTQVGRNGPLVGDIYGAKNGVDMVVSVPAGAVAITLPINSIFIGGYNNVGVLAVPRPNSYGFASYGAALNGTQRLARYAAVQAWATAVGANV
jgi:hypothetical protein